MLKIKSIGTVGFVGESDRLVHELTCPLSRKKAGDRFYYKSSLYRIEAPDDAKVRVVVFSAVDVFCCFDELIEAVDCQKCVLYLTDVKKARRIGIRIDRARLSYALECPVVFATRSAKGINRLLEAVHIVSQTPDFITAFENPGIARKSVLTFRRSFLSTACDYIKQNIFHFKNLLLKHI